MANLKLNTLSKIYPSGALALYKNNLELTDSEFIAVVGGEKCGKSTLLRLICGLEEATEGQIIVGDKDVTAVDPKERDIAMIFQGNSLYPALSVYDNLAYGLKIRKASDTLIEQRVKTAAEVLGLTDILNRKPKALTAEQKQRVAFGRAIVREPRLYLLDDPLAGLDQGVKETLRSVLINLQIRMKGTFIYATKNVNEALTMATRIVVLKEGFIQQIDTPANLYDYPANAFVAFTVGSPTINFINGAKIVKDGDGYKAVGSGIEIALTEGIVKRFANIGEYADSDKKIILGIRPEDAVCGEAGGIKAKIASAEEICGKTYADCDLDEISLVCDAGGKAAGDEVQIKIDADHLYIFDAETRLTLLGRDEGYENTGRPDADFKPLAFNEEEAIKDKLKLKPEKKKKK